MTGGIWKMNQASVLKIAAKACDDKRAEDILALDMEGISLVADYFNLPREF